MSAGREINMKGKDINKDWPEFREFGWKLKEKEATTFQMKYHPNSQIVVIANFPLIRGVTCEMVYWWFQHLSNLKVRLQNVGNYNDGDIVPAYFLWHPIDHYDHPLMDDVDDGKWHVGKRVHIQEAFSFDLFERKYLVNSPMLLWYLRDGRYGGHGMGIKLPIGFWVMASRICWESAKEGDVDGVHLHYEMSLGVPNSGIISGILSGIISGIISSDIEEKFQEWRRHGSVEFGAFENFLPRLYAQRHRLEGKAVADWILDYDALTDDSSKELPIQTTSYAPSLVEKRMEGYMTSGNTTEFLQTTQALGDKFYPSEAQENVIRTNCVIL